MSFTVFKHMPQLVLASTSLTRQHLLQSAGLTFETRRPGVDEAAVKARFAGSALELASHLAQLKALAVSVKTPSSLVIGADQTLEYQGQSFNKPDSVAEAHEQLRALRGQSHHLHSAIALARGSAILWSGLGTARLTMRNFSDEELDHYLTLLGEKALLSVGGYQLEGLGINLFEAVEGDYFTILGLPLTQLLPALRQHGVGPL